MWVVGAVMQVLGIVLYYQKGLYADCGMEFYYLAMTAYGFWRWQQKAPSSPAVAGEDGATAITHIPIRIALLWTLIALSLWALIWYLLSHFTDSTVPVADAFTTALSFVGIWALAHKYLEQWFVWIAVDVVTCALYFHKDIPFKAGLYGLYILIAIAGYYKWRRVMKSARVATEKPQGAI